MKVVAVAGSGSGCGKTTVVCALLRAFPGLGALKISPREGPARLETGPGAGDGKDTARYSASGAVAVARAVGGRDSLPGLAGDVRRVMEGCRAVVAEGADSRWLPAPRLSILVLGGPDPGSRIDRLRDLVSRTDIVVLNKPTMRDANGIVKGVMSHLARNRKVTEVGDARSESETWSDLVLQVGAFIAEG